MEKRKIKGKKGNILNIPSVYKPRSKAKKVSRKSLIIGIFLAGFFIWASDLVNINFRPMIQNDPAVLRIFAPSVAQKGTAVEFTVECWDYSERLSCGYDGTVSFSAEREPSINASMVAASAQFSASSYTFVPSGINQGIIEAYRIPWGDQAHKSFIVTFTEPGIHYIKVLDSELSSVPYYSNPVLVVDGVPESFLYWGDIHGHSSMCDGSGYIDQVLFYAKNIACLDFASVTTHDQFINAIVAPYAWPLFWEQTKSLIENWNGKDNFVTIQAHEWRGNFLKFGGDPQGDRIIYSRTSELPFFSGASKAYSNETKLNSALKSWMVEKPGRKVMTIHHHPPHDMMGMRTDWSSFDPEITRLVEMYSVHGSSEMSESQGNPFPLMSGSKEPFELEVDNPGYHIRDALSMGYRLGFMASGDSHDGHIGHSLSHTEARHLWQPPLSWSAFSNHMFRCNHWQQNGLIGVFSPTLSREGIFDAMWNRACYGIKGTSRPYIDFAINGTSVGVNESILVASSVNATRNITLNVAAGGGDGNYLKKIEIIKNNDVWKTLDFTGQQKRIYHGEIVDNSTMTGLSYWDYSGVDTSKAPYYKDGKYYINEDANIGVDSLAEMSTNNETFYYIRVHTVGSVYYNNLYDTDYHNMPLIDRGDDVAWVGPIWVNPN